MQESAALARLQPMAIIPEETVPRSKRSELAGVVQAKRAVRARIASGAFLTLLTGFFAAAYGAAAILAWTGGGPMILRLLFSLFSAGLLVANRHLLSETFAAVGEFRRLAAPPALLRDAEAEQSIDDAVAAMNAKAAAWNEAAAVAETNRVDARYVVRLRGIRDDLERRRETIVTGLAQAWVAAATAESAPKALPPPSDRRPVVRTDLKSS